MLATCGFCGRKFDAPDHLAGAHMACPQCGGAATVPAMPAPPPPEKSRTPDILAAWTLVLGVASALCGCVFTPVTLVVGLITLTKAHADPVHYALARRKAFIGICLSILLGIGSIVALVMWANSEEKAEAQELATVDDAYRRGDWATAKRLYETKTRVIGSDNKFLVHTRLGRIYMAEGNPALAREMFVKAVREKPEGLFTCDDPATNTLFAEVRASVQR